MKDSWHIWGLALLGLIAFQCLLAKWRVRRDGDARRSRAKRAIRGEKQAQALLKRNGYDVLDAQPLREWTVLCDGEEWSFQLRADFIVRKRGLTYVAEVKTGALGTTISHSGTRRQLLEYFFAYDVDGVLLVDVEHRTISEVEFPDLPDEALGPRSAA